MRPQSELITLSQMQKCTCVFLHLASDLCGGEA
nr:hypothetical protein [Escherichia coli]